jgi:uncharacterized protein DUF6851/vanadium-dependent haloperoxidase-like protein
MRRNAYRWRPVWALAMLAVIAGAGPAMGSTPGADWTDSVAARWNQTLQQAILDAHPGPPMSARMLAVVNTCMYDAWAAYDPVAVGTRLGGALRRPAAEQTLANKKAAISYAAYRALLDLFPGADQAAKFQAAMRDLGYDPADASTDTAHAAGVGNVAALAVCEFRHHDGSNQLGDLSASHVPYSDYTGYTPVNTVDQINDPNHWQPLLVPDGKGGFTAQTYSGPFWGNVIPFAMTSGSQFRALNPPARWNGSAESSVEYVEQARDLINLSANLTDRQKVIVEHWADGPGTTLPPGHWVRFAGWVAARDNLGLDDEMKLFFLVSNAVFDAGISCWDTKRVYDSVRPITAIHFLFKGQKIMSWGGRGQGTKEIDGSVWRPYQFEIQLSPPFPAFASGHSTFSAAAAEVMKRFTGSDAFGASFTMPAGKSQGEPRLVPAADVTLTWDTFTQAADEAGMSRRYGGIHFAADDYTARYMGREVGVAVWEKAQSYFNGTAAAN